ncbi:MAG: hypothetical protein AUG08_02025 [Acidobacteria bacterium 13_1_20CM_2_55_15]|nr:MAG: hypothetical protein AUI45_08910 [Acidobacteria bacterium 13_1_40CM_2_56_11]OLE89994.1 MAG: hypothetical protein AUG08_02025 [Acidobacteria bacterium 13_1_20CM_2_55_15]
MIELGKFLARIGSSGVGGASNGLFQRSDGRRLMMTLTDELFLPTRIVYCVKDREELVSRFHNLRLFIGYSHQAVSGHSRTFSERLCKSMTFFRNSTTPSAASPERQSGRPSPGAKT